MSGKPIATCNCTRHRKVCLKNSIHGKCNCSGEHFVEVKLEYSMQAEDFVCSKCRHYPVWVQPAKELSVEDREDFNQDLRSLLATWNLEPDDEFSMGEQWLVNLAGKSA
jgi:hypothetical protein